MPLPPDPDNENERRSDWAERAIARFRHDTGSDLEDAAADLIGDMGHWCDRYGVSFTDAIRRGLYHYASETSANGELDWLPSQQALQFLNASMLDLLDSRQEQAEESA
jgi:hypothetical protein